MSLKIGMTYDLKTDWVVEEGQPVDTNAEFDSQRTVDMISSAMEAAGHTVKHIGNAKKLMEQMPDLGVDVVFNFCEGYRGRNRESEVPMLLEMHGIPFIGADALTLGVTLDKVMAKRVFQGEGIPTPKFFVAHNKDDIEQAKQLRYPLIVKTRYEGTSKGLTQASRVENEEQLREQIDHITGNYDQPALVEEFIKGTEFTLGVLGNGNPRTSWPIQVSINGSTDLGDEFFTHQYVVDENVIKYICPAPIPEGLAKKMQELTVKTYKAVDCRDFGRVDFRVDEDGNPYVLEINPLPSLAHNDVFNVFPQAMGIAYNDIIREIVDHGLKRNGLKLSQKDRDLVHESN